MEGFPCAVPARSKSKRIEKISTGNYSDEVMAEGFDASQTEWRGYSCPSCHKLFRLRTGAGGRKVKCPSCPVILNIPKPDPGHGSSIPASVAPPREQAQPVTAAVSEDTRGELAGPEFRRAEEREKKSAGDRRKRRKVVKSPKEQEEFSWESDVTGQRHAGSRRRGGLRLVVFGGLGTVSLVAGVVVAVVLMGGESNRQGLAASEDTRGPRNAFQLPREEAPGENILEIRNSNLQEELGKIVKLVERFLAAETVEKLLESTRRDPVLEEKIRKYYQTQELVAVTPKAVASAGRILKARNYWAVDVVMPDNSTKPITVERVESGYVVDWESWVGYSELSWEELRQLRPREPVLFRVLCSPVQYYNYGFKDDRKWRSYRLESPDRKHTFYGYVERLSSQERGLSRHDVREGQVLAFILRIRYTDDSGPDQVIIDEVVSSGWLTPVARQDSPAVLSQ